MLNCTQVLIRIRVGAYTHITKDLKIWCNLLLLNGIWKSLFQRPNAGGAKQKIKQTKQISSVVHEIYECTSTYVYTWIILPPLLIEMSLSPCFSNVNTLMNHLRKPLKCRLWDRKCGVCPESSHLCKFLWKKMLSDVQEPHVEMQWHIFNLFSVYDFSNKVKFLRVHLVSEITKDPLNTCMFVSTEKWWLSSLDVECRIFEIPKLTHSTSLHSLTLLLLLPVIQNKLLQNTLV